MPWWRSQCWGAKHIWLTPSLMRTPIELENSFKQLHKKEDRPMLISLVPTQLQRLLNHPAGVRCLSFFSVIWVGGDVIPHNIEAKARALKMRLAPCYGSTETAAMVTALTPDQFLAGGTGCGTPLCDVELDLDKKGALKIRTPRLAKGFLENGNFKELYKENGWWTSGDAAELHHANDSSQHLAIIGRLDSAINSGGETVFPDKLQTRLLNAAIEAELPIGAVLLLGVPDTEWGNRLVALVRWKHTGSHQTSHNFLKLKSLVNNWIPAERPIAWYNCHELTTNASGKWEAKRWEAWIKRAESQHLIF